MKIEVKDMRLACFGSFLIDELAILQYLARVVSEVPIQVPRYHEALKNVGKVRASNIHMVVVSAFDNAGDTQKHIVSEVHLATPQIPVVAIVNDDKELGRCVRVSQMNAINELSYYLTHYAKYWSDMLDMEK